MSISPTRAVESNIEHRRNLTWEEVELITQKCLDMGATEQLDTFPFDEVVDSVVSPDRCIVVTLFPVNFDPELGDPEDEESIAVVRLRDEEILWFKDPMVVCVSGRETGVRCAGKEFLDTYKNKKWNDLKLEEISIGWGELTDEERAMCTFNNLEEAIASFDKPTPEWCNVIN